MTENTFKERDASGVYFRRIVSDDNGAVVSDERIKRDPVLTFVPPVPAHIANGVASFVIELQLRDFDSEPRDGDSGTIAFRLRDREDSSDPGVTFTRPLLNGVVALTLEFDTPGTYVIVCDPPFAYDALLGEELFLEVRP